MLSILDEFRKTLDDIMLQAMHKRVVLYGYGYTGRFLKWYAEYYHSIKVDYIVSMDMRFGQAYDLEIFRRSLFDFHYKDVEDAVVWLAEPMDDEIDSFLKKKGYIKDKTFFDFYGAIYGNDVSWESENTDVFKKRKSGKRDIQFLEWLEWKYQCNFITAIDRENLPIAGEHGAAYRVTTQKEIFPILDRCHCIPTERDAIFDYGCGKGGAMVSFLDYGFTCVGGVEYEPQIYDILLDNLSKLNWKDNKDIECIQGNAAEVKEQLDKYNWFFFFNPFDDYIFRQCIDNMCESLKRCERKIRIISIAPNSYRCIEETGCFRLTNQFTIDSRQRVVDVFESYIPVEIPISVIIPVYNVYEWLDECMESLCNQTFHDFEMILINDGSTDESGAKCEQWALKDPRIRYISKKNEGLALTRNLGIKEAKGKYIVFIDSDDWVDPRFLELLYSKIEETGADLVECDFWRYDNNTGNKTYRVCYGRMGKEYNLEEHMIYGQTTAWKYISKKALWTDNRIEMPDCMSASHGVYALLLALSNKVVNVHEALYYYRRFRKGSILDTNGKSGNQKGTLGLSALEYLVKQFHECGLYEQYRETVEKIVIYSLTDYLASQFGRLDKPEFDVLTETYYGYIRSAFPQIKNDKYIMIGGYNLNRILFHVNMIHNPYCRFNFSSIISIMSPSSGIVCKHKNKYRENMILRDISAQFWAIAEEVKPKYLFMDLLEERFDIIEYKGTYITKSDAFDGIEEAFEDYRIIARNSQECELLWKQKCLEFLTEVQKHISGENIVLVKSYLSEFVGDFDHKEQFEDIQDIKKVNAILKGYYDFMIDNCQGIKVVEASKCPMYFTDIRYEYGAIPSHLNEIVNEKIAKEIEGVIALDSKDENR